MYRFFSERNEQALKAIIMAGGEGKRLRPITEKIPKPLVEVGGIPIIEHIFKLLIKHNISEAWITTRYLGNLIEERLKQLSV